MMALERASLEQDASGMALCRFVWNATPYPTAAAALNG
jgi:hypothetical protein